MKSIGSAPARLEGIGSSDAALLTAVAGGNLGALGVLYDRHARDVWRVLERVTNGANDVEDLVHTTFLKLPDIAESFDGRPSCKNWICGVAVRIALRRGRSVHRFARVLSRFAEAGALGPRADDPESQAIHREQLGTIDRALRGLSPKVRAVFVLVELQGVDQEEVARALEIPAATVRTRLFAARQKLREAVEREGDSK
jgi:RNA polymerase sigma-70 factor, ECF subfamily